MTDHTPITEEVEKVFTGEEPKWGGTVTWRRAMFYRWLVPHNRKVAARTLRDFVADQDDMREAFDSIQGSGVTPIELVTYRAIKQAERIEAGEDCEPDLANDRKIAAEAWDAAVKAMRYEDGTPVELVSVVNPYRADRIEQGGQG